MRERLTDILNIDDDIVWIKPHVRINAMFAARIFSWSYACGCFDNFSLAPGIFQDRFQKVFILRAVGDQYFALL